MVDTAWAILVSAQVLQVFPQRFSRARYIGGMSHSQTRSCPYCGRVFQPSRYCPAQRICSGPDCQLRRRVEDHRKRRQFDPVYRQTCLNSQGKWREAHPHYSREYRRRRAEADHNRAGPPPGAKNTLVQRRPDWIAALERSVKNNLALPAELDSVPVFRLSAVEAHGAKNTLAFPQLFVLMLDRSAQEDA